MSLQFYEWPDDNEAKPGTEGKKPAESKLTPTSEQSPKVRDIHSFPLTMKYFTVFHLERQKPEKGKSVSPTVSFLPIQT